MTHFKYDELYQKYLNLLEENTCLKAKIKELEAEPNTFKFHSKPFQTQELFFKEPSEIKPDNRVKKEPIETGSVWGKSVNHYSVKEDKIALFMSLFKGRSDVYAKR